VWYLSGARCRLAYAQLMPLPLTVSCFSKIQIGCTFLVLAHLGSPGQRTFKRVCVCSASSVSCQHFLLSVGACYSYVTAERRRCSVHAAIDGYLLPTGHSAANLLQATAAVDRWDRLMDGQTDRRTPDRYIDPSPHTCVHTLCTFIL